MKPIGTVVTDHLDEVEELQRLGQEHPDVWIEQVFRCRLWEKQAAIARSVVENARTAVRSCSGSGKSFIAARAAMAFLHNFEPSTVITTAPTFRQVEMILWREIAAAMGQANVRLGGDLTSVRLDIQENWFAVGLSTDHPERFQGFHNEHILVIGDEAGGLSEAIYSAIENPMATGDAHELLIGNPTQPVGPFRDCFTSPLYQTFHISAFDTPNFTELGITRQDIRDGTWERKVRDRALPYPGLVSPKWVAERYADWGEGSYLWLVYVEGDFPGTGVNSLFDLADVEAAMERTIEPTGEKICGLDVARYGDAETVFGVRQGDHVFPMTAWSHSATTHTAGRTKRHILLNNPTYTCVDSVGVGGGVADMLRDENVPVVDFNAGAASVDKEKFGNRRAELYWALSRKCAEGTLDLPQDAKLKGELCDIRYRYDQRGKMWIETKEEARSRGTRSPDRADVVMMMFAPPRSLRRGGKPNQKVY